MTPVESKIRNVLEQYCKEKLYTDAYAAVLDIQSNEILLKSSVHFSALNNPHFDLASLTKALATAPLVLKSLNEKSLDPLKTKVSEWLGTSVVDKTLPKFFYDFLVIDLLSHRSGLPAWVNFYTSCASDSLDSRTPDTQIKRNSLILKTLKRISQVSKEAQGRHVYSDVGMIFLGYCLERIYKKSIGTQFTELQQTLKGNETVFYLGTKSSDWRAKHEFVDSGYCELRKARVSGEVHDENCFYLGEEAGHAGLFATGDGLAEWICRLFNSDLGKDYLNLNEFLQKKDPTLSVGLRVGDDPQVQMLAPCFGHYGFTGSSFWVNRESKRCVILLCNRTHFQRLDDRMKAFRKEAHEILRQLF